jgi:ubiquinone/menaquinone biosynthesis C-methylase UbiE
MNVSKERRTSSRRSPASPGAAHVLRNRQLWDAQSEEYERRHGRTLSAAGTEAWGFFRIPERKLRLLGPTRGRMILELGCGAGRWSAGLKAGGGRPIGIDVSSKRLVQACQVQGDRRVRFPLVRADAERLPFRDASFDIVFCDWGAMTFCDPYRTVPEVARIVRSGGVFAFSNSSPSRTVSHDRTRDRIRRSLLYDYFGMHRIEYPGETNFQLEYGEWIRLFREHRFFIDRLIEPRAPPLSKSSYLSAEEMAWCRRWPIEVIWRLVKESPRRQARG